MPLNLWIEQPPRQVLFAGSPVSAVWESLRRSGWFSLTLTVQLQGSGSSVQVLVKQLKSASCQARERDTTAPQSRLFLAHRVGIYSYTHSDEQLFQAATPCRQRNGGYCKHASNSLHKHVALQPEPPSIPHLGEPQRNLVCSRLGRVRAVDQIAANIESEVRADRAGGTAASVRPRANKWSERPR
jgi:hypothetical protein